MLLGTQKRRKPQAEEEEEEEEDDDPELGVSLRSESEIHESGLFFLLFSCILVFYLGEVFIFIFLIFFILKNMCFYLVLHISI